MYIFTWSSKQFLVRFIPGFSASDVHYQGFLLEGLSRWNQARTLAASQQQDCQLRSFNLQLAFKINRLSESFLGTRLLPYHHAPTQHNAGEFFGVEYLYQQAGRQFVLSEDSTLLDDGVVDEMDEGFVDESMAAPSISEHLLTVGAGALGEEVEEEEEETEDEADTTIVATTSTTTTIDNTTSDPRGIPGWDKVGQLAEALVELTGIALSVVQVNKIKSLCDALDDYDKRAIEVYLRLHQPHLRGHFCSQKRTGHTTTEQMRRYV